MELKNLWNTYSKEQLASLEEISEVYKAFLNTGKTERECVDSAILMARQAGYRGLSEVIREKKKLEPGDKVYAACMNKEIILFRIGTDPMEAGMNILGAHVDSPRMDVKQKPLFEDSEIAYLDTHYYGGIKKYQWITIPLALHGVVVKKDGTRVSISVGEKEEDPVLIITDLLIHLASDQMEKTGQKLIEGEKLDVLFGSRPLPDTEKDAVKAGVAKILHDEYGLEEDDFISAELEIVPAGKARDCGIDRSMIMGYGHDDRVCAFASLFAMFQTHESKRTSCCILVDKEEIGSVGATGMQSRFFENTVAEIMNLTGEFNDLALRRALANSKMLSSDVSAAFDPLYPENFEKRNTAFFGKGICFNKYTGVRGKSGSNDCNAEFLAQIRRIMDKEDVQFQTAELGKVDGGGGGTIAYIMALYGMEVIDSGVPVLSMHAPWEVVSKADLYESVRGYKAFLREA